MEAKPVQARFSVLLEWSTAADTAKDTARDTTRVTARDTATDTAEMEQNTGTTADTT